MGTEINKKIGKYLNSDYIDDSIKNKDKIAEILDLKYRCLEKVSSGEWSKKDYKDFCGVIGKITLDKFDLLYKIILLFLDLPHNQCITEIEHLSKQDVFNINNNDSYGKKLANIIKCIDSKIYLISHMAIIKEEKILYETIEKRIEAYENIYKQIKDENSDYLIFLNTTYEFWIDETFENKTVKDTMLSFNKDVIDLKKKRIREKVEYSYYLLEKEKTKNFDSYALDKNPKGKKRDFISGGAYNG